MMYDTFDIVNMIFDSCRNTEVRFEMIVVVKGFFDGRVIYKEIIFDVDWTEYENGEALGDEIVDKVERYLDHEIDLSFRGWRWSFGGAWTEYGRMEVEVQFSDYR